MHQYLSDMGDTHRDPRRSWREGEVGFKKRVTPRGLNIGTERLRNATERYMRASLGRK